MAFIADSEMPRSATGKILHRTLRDRLAGVVPVTTAAAFATFSTAAAILR